MGRYGADLTFLRPFFTFRPAGVVPEDPYLWVDKRDHWHIINHAYSMNQTAECAASVLSTHFFSVDGKDWRCSDTEPYGHRVQYDDGTNHTYAKKIAASLYFLAGWPPALLPVSCWLLSRRAVCFGRWLPATSY